MSSTSVSSCDDVGIYTCIITRSTGSAFNFTNINLSLCGTIFITRFAVSLSNKIATPARPCETAVLIILIPSLVMSLLSFHRTSLSPRIFNLFLFISLLMFSNFPFLCSLEINPIKSEAYIFTNSLKDTNKRMGIRMGGKVIEIKKEITFLEITLKSHMGFTKQKKTVVKRIKE